MFLNKSMHKTNLGPKTLEICVYESVSISGSYAFPRVKSQKRYKLYFDLVYIVKKISTSPLFLAMPPTANNFNMMDLKPMPLV